MDDRTEFDAYWSEGRGMAADTGIVWPFVIAAAAAQASGVVASSWDVPIGDYIISAGFALVGIIGRHFSDAGDALKNDTFDLGKTFKALAVDLPTAPFMGVVIYIGCNALDISLFWSQGIIAGVGYLGPEYIRVLLTRAGDVIFRKAGQ